VLRISNVGEGAALDRICFYVLCSSCLFVCFDDHRLNVSIITSLMRFNVSMIISLKQLTQRVCLGTGELPLPEQLGFGNAQRLGNSASGVGSLRDVAFS